MLCITFDNFGCGADFGFGQGKLPPKMRPERVPLSEWDQYNAIGLTLGQPRMLDLLKRLAIPTTFFSEGYSAVLHPVEMKRWVEEGHEIALHGWKHEIWTKVPSKEKEAELISLGMAAMRDTLGDAAPIGFRPPGLKINRWTEDILEENGIKYVSQVPTRAQSFSDRFDKLGIDYADEGGDVTVTRLKVQSCSDDLTDAFLIAPEFGGLFGTGDAYSGYDVAYKAAVEHERNTPDKPWVFIAHPMVSGNRAWPGFEKFLTQLREEFGSDRFKRTRDVVLAH